MTFDHTNCSTWPEGCYAHSMSILAFFGVIGGALLAYGLWNLGKWIWLSIKYGNR